MLCLFILFIEKTISVKLYAFSPAAPCILHRLRGFACIVNFFISFWVYSVGYKNNNNKIMRKDCHKFTVLRFRRMSLAPESHLAAKPVHSSNF